MQGIYCIENWSARRANRNSVRPLLEFLETSGVSRYIYRQVSSVSDLESAVGDWAPRKQHPVAYVALHGSAESVYVGRYEVDLDHLFLTKSDLERPFDLGGKTAFLASCSTLAADRRSLRKWVNLTKLNTLCGYGRDVDWFAAAAFDLLVLSALSTYKRPSDAIKYLHPRLRRVPEDNAVQSRARLAAEPLGAQSLIEFAPNLGCIPLAVSSTPATAPGARCHLAIALCGSREPDSATVSPTRHHTRRRSRRVARHEGDCPQPAGPDERKGAKGTSAPETS